MRPYDAKNAGDVEKLWRSFYRNNSFGIDTSGYSVSIRTTTGLVWMHRDDFNKLIDWYMRDQAKKQSGAWKRGGKKAKGKEKTS